MEAGCAPPQSADSGVTPTRRGTARVGWGTPDVQMRQKMWVRQFEALNMMIGSVGATIYNRRHVPAIIKRPPSCLLPLL